MPRSKGGTVARKSHKKVMSQAKGYFSPVSYTHLTLPTNREV